jgi:alkanesulfonate monooxygenase SsuD/methylene tetrahydromethanopterin reductase-like flavin-dependent oxidoreductase (luciferase family)
VSVKVGYASGNSSQGMHPGVLARELEQRGFESLWVPEHSHIPVRSVSQYPDPRSVMPSGYAHLMSPLISLMAAASTTSKLKLCTGMCLALEHDLLDLACMTATLDVLSNARLILGVGVGWNTEEFGNHRPGLPFQKRYSALRERVAALRAAWGHSPMPYDGPHAEQEWSRQISAFAGEYDKFTPSWVFPKPLAGTIPVALGLAGPTGMSHAASYADIWAPVDISMYHNGRHDVAGLIAHFRQLVAEAGRDPRQVPISLFVWGGESMAMIESYAALGVERLVIAPPTMNLHSASDTLQRLDALQVYVDRFRG